MRWTLASLGLLTTVYSILVLGYIATSPDLRLRTLTVDAEKSQAGVTIRDTPGLETQGPRPQVGDLVTRVGPRDSQVRSFSDLVDRMAALREAEVPSGGIVYSPSEIAGLGEFLPWLVRDEQHGDRWVEIEFIPGDQLGGNSAPVTTWVKIQSLPANVVILSLVWMVLQLVLVGFGLVAYWNRPFDRAARAFLLMSVATLGAFVGGFHWWVIARNLWLTLPFIYCAVAVPALMLHFFLVFPRVRPVVESRWFLLAIYLPPAFAATAFTAMLSMIGASQQLGDAGAVLDWLVRIRFAMAVYLVAAAAYYAVTLAVLHNSLRTASGPAETSQLKWIWRAAVLSSVLVGYAFFLAVFRKVEFALGGSRIPMFAASLLFMSAYAVGVVRHRWILVDRIVGKGAVYYIYTTAITLGFGLAIAIGSLLPHTMNISLTQQQVVTAAAVLTVAVMLLLWLRDAVQRVLDRRFFREKYQLDKALAQLNQAAGRIAEPDEVGSLMLGSCRDVLGVERAALYLKARRGSFHLAANHEFDHLPLQLEPDAEFLKQLAERGSLQATTPASRDELNAVQYTLRELQADIVHALEVDGKLGGFVVLAGGNRSGAYSAEDLTFLNALCRIANAAVHSVQVDRDAARLNERLAEQAERLRVQQRQIAVLQAELAGPAAGGSLRAAAGGFDRGAVRGDSPAIREVLSTARKVADSSSTVLLRGESGTGKELLAQVLHDNSSRKNAPIVRVHCAALAAGLLESELFGHMKGSFTGAHQDRVGRFEMADGGTLFLDEIGDISMETQVKLLRVLQERSFEPVGGTKTINVNVRLIAATNRDLERMISEGEFREDLYYRLNVISLTLPPLRERRDDIIDLAMHFLARSAARSGKAVHLFDDEALALLTRHRWPGNIRELENVVERAVVLADSHTIMPDDVPAELRNGAAETPAGERRVRPSTAAAEKRTGRYRRRRADSRAERGELLAALEDCAGNKAEAARLLNMPRSTFFSKLKKHDIS